MSRNLTYLDCHATVTRKGEIEPCGREVVGWLSDTEAAVGDYYPVCIHHLHQSFMAERVPLRELLAQAWDEGHKAGCADPYARYDECDYSAAMAFEIAARIVRGQA